MSWGGFPAVGTAGIKTKVRKIYGWEADTELSETQDMDSVSHGYELVIHSLFFFLIKG